jgi:hypothetical protein
MLYWENVYVQFIEGGGYVVSARLDWGLITEEGG